MSRSFIFPIAVFLLMTGCTSTKRISDYSTSALKTIEKFDELGHTFMKACKDKCYLENVRELKLSTDECQCAPEQTADNVTSALYNVIKGYYDGLVKLSANELTSYKTDALKKQLTSGTFGDVKIDKTDVDAYTKLSSVLLTAFTDGYRSKKLNSYVGEANEPIQILIRLLKINLASNLTGRIQVHRQRLQSVYFDLLQDPAASSYEKKNIIDAYHGEIDELESKISKISIFSKGLNSVAAGHQKLYDNRNKMSPKEIKVMLVQYVSDLEDVLSEFNKTKSK